MWKGAIQFGLVTIPVKLYLATESRAGVSFNMLHAADLSRIQMKIFCPVEDEVISRSDTVKGFEYSPGEYVVVTNGCSSTRRTSARWQGGTPRTIRRASRPAARTMKSARNMKKHGG